MNELTIGYDSEFHLKDEQGELKSAIGIIPGTKEKQHIMSTGAGLHHDNVSLEIAFKPFNTFGDMEDHIEMSLHEVREMIAPYTLCSNSSNIFPESELRSAKAQEFGCDPDFNAWNGGMQNEFPTRENEQLRTNGTHVHMGNERLAKDFKKHLQVIKNMDCSVGIWSLDHDNDTQRRLLYGRAGAFRPKVYGLEYRTLGSFWILNKRYRSVVWKTTTEVFDRYINKTLLRPGKSVEDLINANKV